MSRSIRLHPEHGVNPTMLVCFFCNEDTGEIALLGAAYKGEAPRRMVLNYTPCNKCQERMKLGITLIEATPTANTHDQPEIQRGVYPTGRWAVITEDAAKRWFRPETHEEIFKHRNAFVEPGIIPSEGEHEAGHA